MSLSLLLTLVDRVGSGVFFGVFRSEPNVVPLKTPAQMAGQIAIVQRTGRRLADGAHTVLDEMMKPKIVSLVPARVVKIDQNGTTAYFALQGGPAFPQTCRTLFEEITPVMSLGQQLAPHLPFLRRYGRALTGSQAQGDKYVRATLEAIVAAPEEFPRDVDPRLGLYHTFQAIWSSANYDELDGDDGDVDQAEAVARARLARMTPMSRQALLLTAMEGFTPEDTAYLIGVDEGEVDGLVRQALDEIEKQTRARVLIIEDEPIIAMDIETIVRDLGHDVTGVAVTRDEAVALAMEDRPGLVLADIQLADDSSGIDAVKDILAKFQVPVIFITAFPERLLTGERPEPTFLITKPFQRSTVKAAISQALFFDQATVPAT